MAKLSSQFAAISPGMDTESSTDYLVSTMQAYGISVDEVQRKVLDNVNAIGNSMATSNAEIGEMLTRSSAAMKAANNTLEETIALESAAVEITRKKYAPNIEIIANYIRKSILINWESLGIDNPQQAEEIRAVATTK